ncbi:MAG: F0F1 ATP synthase subunit epsilon [Bacteroidales bacterium]|nr:F0F1 ATP synthase subunit epsilon [Bacteroidales bacterium]
MTLDIYSPSETLFSGEVTAVFLPGTKGSFEVLQNHASIITSLSRGELVYRTQEGEASVSISSGFAKVENNHIMACVEL